MTPDYPTLKSGFVAVMGRPNVGKSTLINALLEQKIAAVTPRPQTTRKRQMGILHLPHAQVVFVDTPGVHKPRHKLGENMVQEAAKTLQECDLVMIVVDASQPPQSEDILLAEMYHSEARAKEALLVLNQIDRTDPSSLEKHSLLYQGLVPSATPVRVSALKRQNLEELVDSIVQRLQIGMPFFPDDQLTDLYEREIAADLIREAALIILRDEVPHGIAVRIDQFTERGDTGAYIEATLFVEKESHKPILIGEGGKMLKAIGSHARQEIESMSGRSVYLRLRVKVRKNWRNDDKVLRSFGFSS